MLHLILCLGDTGIIERLVLCDLLDSARRNLMRIWRIQPSSMFPGHALGGTFGEIHRDERQLCEWG